MFVWIRGIYRSLGSNGKRICLVFFSVGVEPNIFGLVSYGDALVYVCVLIFSGEVHTRKLHRVDMRSRTYAFLCLLSVQQ